MSDIFVGRLMSSPVRTVSRDASVDDAARLMLEHGVGSLVVTDGENRLEGILTATDFVRIVADGSSAREATVDDYMSTDLVTTTANEPIGDVADVMIENGIHHAPVVDDTEGVVGMLTTTDFTAYLSHVRSPSPE